MSTEKKEVSTLDELTALSPIDGRYGFKTKTLRPLLSEHGLIKSRVMIEVLWVQKLISKLNLVDERELELTQTKLKKIVKDFDKEAGESVKALERSTNHDVKAVEYYLRDNFKKDRVLNQLIPFIHFGCTSEDINNLAHSTMLKEARDCFILPSLQSLSNRLRLLANRFATIGMLSRTHGQPASPTTMGKELANFVHRLECQSSLLSKSQLKGKLNGAVGNYNAFQISYPEMDWPEVSSEFILELGLEPNPYTTQIEPHDSLARFFNDLCLINSILIDLSRDIWTYISLGYFSQKRKESEVGSSTMPHKINPINFENAEGNLGIANSLFRHFSDKLTISRLQRDLSDSTVLRNLGVAIAHQTLALEAIQKGLEKLDINEELIRTDLEDCWDILAEPIQMVMRSCGIEDAYEKLKTLSRGKALNEEIIHQFLDSSELPNDKIKLLKNLTPATYVGLAPKLAKDI